MVQGHHEGGGASVPTIAIRAVSALANPREKTGMLGRQQPRPLHLIKKGGKERSKKIGGDSRSQMLTHILQPPSSLSSPLICCKEEKESIQKGLPGDGWNNAREQQWLRKVHFFFLPTNIVQKVQTLTKLLLLEGKQKEDGQSWKEPTFFQIFSSGKLSLPSLPLLPHCCQEPEQLLYVCTSWGVCVEWIWGEGL